MNKLLLIGLVIILLVPIVGAVKDIFVYPEEAGYGTIVYSQSLIYIQGQPAHFVFDVLNMTGFKMDSTKVNCSFDSVDNNGNLITAGWAHYNATEKYWSYRLNATHLKDTGTYGWYVHCNGSKPYSAASASYIYLVTPDGEGYEVTDTTSGLSVVAFLLFMIIGMFVVSFKVDFTESDNANLTIKTAFAITGLYLTAFTLTIVTSITSQAHLHITNNLLGILSILNIAIYTGIIVLIISFIFRVIKNFGRTKENRRMGGDDE